MGLVHARSSGRPWPTVRRRWSTTTWPWSGPGGSTRPTIMAPTLLLHGGDDRMIPASHGAWLAGRVPGGELVLRPEDGHVSVMQLGARAVAWLAEHARPE